MPTAGSSSLKRKRVVESCLECYRRKQKCNRQHPCNNCSVRNVPGKCTFNTSAVSRPEACIQRPSTSTNEVGQGQSPIQDDRESSQLGSGSLGYSSVPGSNAFVGLQQILGNDEFEKMNAVESSAFNSRVARKNTQTLVSKLPPRPVLQTLVNVFFAEVNWHYFILERFYFDDLFSRWPHSEELEPVSYLRPEELSRELRYFSALLFQVVSLTLQFLSPDHPDMAQISADALDTSQTYSDLGDELLSVLGRPGAALSGVQADFLRSSWLKNVGRVTEAWHSFGNAIRQAQELGLHRQREIRQPDETNISKTLSSLWYEENKKRLWINLFVWDSFMAMILGRPRMIHRDDCDAKPPMECSIPKNPSTAVPMAVRLDENPGIIPVSASLFRYAIACKIHDMRAIKLDRSHPKVYSAVRKIHEDVDLLMDGLLPSIRPDCPDTSWDLELPYLPQLREELKVMANLFVVNLHRPHIISSTESRKAALQAAIATLDFQLRSFAQTKPYQYHSFSLAFYMVDASFLLSIITILYPPENHETRQNIETSLRRSIDSLSTMRDYNPIAKAGFGVVQRCYSKLREAFKSPNNASGPHPAPHGSSTIRLQSLMRDLSEYTVDSSMGSLLDPSQLTNSPDLGLPTPPVCGLQDSFDQGYWLEQLNQIQPSLIFEQEPHGMWENVWFD